jgi:hypothetical protein
MRFEVWKKVILSNDKKKIIKFFLQQELIVMNCIIIYKNIKTFCFQWFDYGIVTIMIVLSHNMQQTWKCIDEIEMSYWQF